MYLIVYTFYEHWMSSSAYLISYSLSIKPAEGVITVFLKSFPFAKFALKEMVRAGRLKLKPTVVELYFKDVILTWVVPSD